MSYAVYENEHTSNLCVCVCVCAQNNQLNLWELCLWRIVKTSLIKYRDI